MKPSYWLSLLLLCFVEGGCGDPASCGTAVGGKPSAMPLERHSVRFPSATVSVLSPGPLEDQAYTTSPEENSFVLDSAWSQFYSDTREIQVVVAGTRLREDPVDLYAGVEAIMFVQDKEGATGLEYWTQNTTVSGLTAVRACGRYTENGERAIESVVFGKDTEIWHVSVFVPLRDIETARRIVESVDLRAQAVPD